MVNELTTEKYRAQYNQLYEDAHTWRDHWTEISDYLYPRKGRYLTGTESDQTNDGKKRNSKVINGTGFDAVNVLAAGMQSGLTSPSRPWFSLSLVDKDLAAYAPVKEWLFRVRDTILNIFSHSNFYSAVHNMYGELGGFGTNAMVIEEDFRSVIRCRPFTIGEFQLALDATYRPDTLYRQYSMTARQMIEEFGKEMVTRSVREAYDNNKPETRFEVIHCIRPNTGKDADKGDRRGMEYESIYFEKKASPEKYLRIGGYRDIPFMAPRWEVTGVDTYGRGPGMIALGDVKMLQKMEAKKLKSLDKMVDPPLNAPSSLEKKGATIVAGGVNFVDTQQGNQAMAPVYQVRPDMQNIAFEVDRVEKRLRRFFYNDLFATLLNQDKNMTATEVARRHSDALKLLGPVIERLQAELLDIVVQRTYNIAERLSLFPPPPQEIQGKDFKIEYVSTLAQAQKMVGISAMEQTINFISGVAGVNPAAVDKLDVDKAIDDFADMSGTNPRIIRGEEEVEDVRQQKAQQAAAAAAAASAQPMADTAKTLSETEMDNDSALDRIMSGMGQQ